MEASLLDGCRAAFRVHLNECYGQTEADFVIGHCGGRWPLRGGSMGRAYPGTEAAVRRDDGSLANASELGEVVVRSPHPTMLLNYWNRPDATREKFSEDWLRTGDLARMDEEGYFWFESRLDDVIKSSGYRIGPAEIEECLLRHPSVSQAAVVGAPDPLRGQIVMAYLVAAAGANPDSRLEEELRDLVRSRLAAYQYPRIVEFVTELPMTTSGKVDRAELRGRAATKEG